METQTYRVTGMDCAECASKVQTGVRRLAGVTDAHVDLMTTKLTVTGHADESALRQRVQALGYGLEVDAPKQARVVRASGMRDFIAYLFAHFETQMALLGGALMLVALLLTVANLPPALRAGTLVLAMLVAAFPAARSGINTLFINREFSIDLLMVIAAVGAVLIGELWEGAVVVFLFAIGEALEGYTADRARDSLRSLIDLAPATAIRVLHDIVEETVAVDALRIDDLVLVKPGERVPMDGRIDSGESDVNQAPITGESIPVYKTRGAEVYAGSINGGGMLKIRVTHLAADNTLNRIIALVEQAQSVRAPSQQFIDQFAKVYTPAVVLIALLIATLPPLLFGAPFADVVGQAHGWLYRALSLLVIACPCALVISAPVTVISGITAAARRGVLIKGGAHLEALAQVRAFAFDKTGTLTRGQPAVTGVRTASCTDDVRCEYCDDVLALASAVETRSTHPLAQAVTRAATDRGIAARYGAAEQVENLAGRGVRGLVGGELVTVGSHPLFDAEYPHTAELHEQINHAEAAGQTTMLLAQERDVRGYITLADSIRPESREVVQALKALGVDSVMLTGDNPTVAAAVGAAVGVDTVRAGLLPAQKVDAVRDLLAHYGKVAMIGDGINDTPALAAATVGVAMGGVGSAQAMETADVILMADGLRQLPDAVRLARFTRNLIRQNVAVAFAMKALFLVLAIEGGASLWLAILADVGVSLLVTLNGMRPLRFHSVR